MLLPHTGLRSTGLASKNYIPLVLLAIPIAFSLIPVSVLPWRIMRGRVTPVISFARNKIAHTTSI